MANEQSVADFEVGDVLDLREFSLSGFSALRNIRMQIHNDAVFGDGSELKLLNTALAGRFVAQRAVRVSPLGVLGFLADYAESGVELGCSIRNQCPPRDQQFGRALQSARQPVLVGLFLSHHLWQAARQYVPVALPRPAHERRLSQSDRHVTVGRFS